MTRSSSLRAHFGIECEVKKNQPCGLTVAEGGQKELIVAHDDIMTVLPNSIAWADVASLCVWWLFRAQACALTCAPRLVCRHQITAKCSMKRGFRAVRYTEAREKLSHFFVELCAFLSGIFTITGLFNNLLHRSIVHAAKKAPCRALYRKWHCLSGRLFIIDGVSSSLFVLAAPLGAVVGEMNK